MAGFSGIEIGLLFGIGFSGIGLYQNIAPLLRVEADILVSDELYDEKEYCSPSQFFLVFGFFEVYDEKE